MSHRLSSDRLRFASRLSVAGRVRLRHAGVGEPAGRACGGGSRPTSPPGSPVGSTRTPGDFGHLAVHARGTQPGRHLGLQARVGSPARSDGQGLRSVDGVLCRGGRPDHAIAVFISPVRRFGDLVFGAVFPDRGAQRRDGLCPLVFRSRKQPLAGAVPDEHRDGPDGVPLRGVVGDLWDGDREPEPAGFHRDVRFSRPRDPQVAGVGLGFGVPARCLPGDSGSEPRHPDRQPASARPADRPDAASAAAADHPAESGAPGAFAGTGRTGGADPELRAGGADATGRC